MTDKQISTHVDADTKREIRIAAAKRNMTMSEYLRLAVLYQLDRDAKKEAD